MPSSNTVILKQGGQTVYPVTDESLVMGLEGFVKTSQQSFTDPQKAQARSNISAENVGNKVTSISSSSTNDEYPSALCVYTLLGDVETLINAL